MARHRSGKGISDIGDSTNNPPVETIGDDSEQHETLVPPEQTQALNRAPLSSDGQELEIINTTATITEGLYAQTILSSGLKDVQDSMARMNAIFQ